MRITTTDFASVPRQKCRDFVLKIRRKWGTKKIMKWIAKRIIFEKPELKKDLFSMIWTIFMLFVTPVSIWCMTLWRGFESYHKIFKNVIKNITCRKNLLKSCLFKIRMRYAHFFMNFQSFFDIELKTGKLCRISSEEMFLITAATWLYPILFTLPVWPNEIQPSIRLDM